MNKCLVDFDIIIGSLFDRKPFSEYSTTVLRMCEFGEIIGFLTPVIYGNLYYLLPNTATHNKVIEKLKRLYKITNVLQLDKNVVGSALSSKFKYFEDALQNFAASNDGEVDLILTRNLKDYKHSKLSIFTPETYIKSKNANL